jgi:hypothetical protein
MLEEDCRISFLVHPVKAVTMTIAMIDEIDFDKRIYFLTNDERMHHYQRRRASITGLGL